VGDAHPWALLLGNAPRSLQAPVGTSSTLSDGVMMMQISKGLWRDDPLHLRETPDSNHPLMVKYRAWHKKYEPKERWSTFYLAGILFGEPFVEGLRRTGKNLTPDNFVKPWKR